MKIEENIKLDFDDVLIKPKRANAISREEVVLEREYQFYNSERTWKGIPLMVSNMDTTGCFAMADAFPAIICLHKYYSVDELIKYWENKQYNGNNIFFSFGISSNDIEKFGDFIEQVIDKSLPIPNICIDVANGYSYAFTETIAHFRYMVGKDPIIIAGNICTSEMVESIIMAGADIVKIGIGPGSVCKTRQVTGVGYPQLSALIECADAAHGLKSGSKRLGLICSDGGIKNIGDFGKAFAGNADFVCAGNFWAGCDECKGEWLYRLNTLTGEHEKLSMKFYGMSSDIALEKYNGGKKDYRASEGEVIQVPYKGPVIKLYEEVLGGLRSTCTYVGADSLKDLSKCTTFIRVNRLK